LEAEDFHCRNNFVLGTIWTFWATRRSGAFDDNIDELKEDKNNCGEISRIGT